MKQLLIDVSLFEITPQILKESLNKNGRFLVTGVLQRANSTNQNGRVYPKNILEREIEKYKGREIRENRAYGELDHPESSVVSLKNVSHNIRECYWKGDDVVGVVEILPTPSGNILKELLKAGIRLGISSRGMGSVQSIGDNKVMVAEDFELIGWDFVSNPSTQGAFMENLNESVSKKQPINETYGTDVCGEWCKTQHLIREIIEELA